MGRSGPGMSRESTTVQLRDADHSSRFSRFRGDGDEQQRCSRRAPIGRTTHCGPDGRQTDSAGLRTSPMPSRSVTSWGLGFSPAGVGATTVTVTGPPGVVTMSLFGVVPVNVTGPAIVVPGTIMVGAGLQAATSAGLDGCPAWRRRRHDHEQGSARVLVSPDATTPGTVSFTVHLNDGETAVNVPRAGNREYRRPWAGGDRKLLASRPRRTRSMSCRQVSTSRDCRPRRRRCRPTRPSRFSWACPSPATSSSGSIRRSELAHRDSW